jgi:hypothetical protein
MDNWAAVGILFAISIAVWILSSIFRNREEEQRSPRPRSSASDLDNFLKEIERRKRQGEPPRGRPAPPRAIPVPPPRRAAPPPRPQRVPPSPASPPVVRPIAVPVKRVKAVEPVVLEVVEAVTPPAASAPTQRLPEAIPVTPLPPPQKPEPAPTPAVIAAPETSKLLELLSTPQSLRTALLLREVLGPPVCRRGLMGRSRLGLWDPSARR